MPLPRRVGGADIFKRFVGLVLGLVLRARETREETRCNGGGVTRPYRRLPADVAITWRRGEEDNAFGKVRKGFAEPDMYKYLLRPSLGISSVLNHRIQPAADPAVRRRTMSSEPPKQQLQQREWLCIMPDQEGARARRLEARPRHFEGVDGLVEQGFLTWGGACCLVRISCCPPKLTTCRSGAGGGAAGLESAELQVLGQRDDGCRRNQGGGDREAQERSLQPGSRVGLGQSTDHAGMAVVQCAPALLC